MRDPTTRQADHHRPTRTRISRAALLALLTVLLGAIGVIAAPAAFAQETGAVVVPADAQAGLVVADGDGGTLVQGTAETVIAFTGDVTVAGTVRGTAIALDGRVRVLPGGRVEGDAYSSVQPVVEPGGVVTGATGLVDVRNALEVAGNAIGFVWWVATMLALLALGALLTRTLPRVFDRTVATGTAEVRRVAVTGLLLAIGLPLLAIVLAITVVGIPVALAVVLMLVPLYALGQIAAAWIIGVLVLRRRDRRLLAFFTGFALLQVVSLVPVLGMVTGLASAFGLGALAVIAWRASRTTPEAPTPTPTPTTRPLAV
jgi:hypothetical protein